MVLHSKKQSNGSPTAFLKLALSLTFAFNLFFCGCRATIDSIPRTLEIAPPGVLIDQVPIPEGCPGWATEPPRIDLFDTQHSDLNCNSPTQPSNGAPSFTIDDLSASPVRVPSNETAPEVVITDGERTERRSATHGIPRDEYVHDGGDRRRKATVSRDWQVAGLELEDTIAHYDTLGGKVEVVASSHAAIYSPRFAAARQVQRVHQSRLNTKPTRSTLVDRIVEHDAKTTFGAIKQPRATVRSVGTSIGTILEEHQRGLTVDDVDIPVDWQVALLPYENFDIVKRGVFEVDQQDQVIHFANAAHAWSAVEFAQATVLGMKPSVAKRVAQASAEVVYEMPEGKARLRLVKLASEVSAQPGDTVHFTLRFDNIGDEPIGNVTIIDNLTVRLEYVEDSEECTLDAEFVADDSQSDTLALRWEITEPLEPSEGGVIRFKCRLR